MLFIYYLAWSLRYMQIELYQPDTRASPSGLIGDCMLLSFVAQCSASLIPLYNQRWKEF